MAEKEKLKSLIITETAGKAKALKKFVGTRYTVISTDGFLKDMPKSKLGIEENYLPQYITVRGKGVLLAELKRESLKARRVFFATNLDDEGEFLAEQCCEIFGVNEKSHCRLEIAEMTKAAVKDSLDNARAIDRTLADSFQARQVIDKYISHKIGEYLACKIFRGTKVGRFRAMLLKLISGSQLDGDFEIGKKFTPEVIQELALRNLNFSSTKTRLALEQLYEGFSFGKHDFAGLIKFPRGEEIFLSSEERTPDSVKEFLTNTQYKLYDLIYKKITGGAIENKFTLRGECNELALMATFDSLKIDWAKVYSVGINSLLKRRYIELDAGMFKVTDLGNEVLDALSGYFDDIFSVDGYKEISAQIEKIRAGQAEKNFVVEKTLSEFDKIFDRAWSSLGENPQPKDEPVIDSNEICEKCGRPMVIKRGRYGNFLACSGYPECKNAKPIMNYLDKKCPKCGGRLTKREFSGGRNLYGCENFATCDFKTWDDPQERLCNVCGSTMFLHRFKDRAPMLYCGNKNCQTRENHPMNKILEEAQKRYTEKKLRREKRKGGAAK